MKLRNLVGMTLGTGIALVSGSAALAAPSDVIDIQKTTLGFDTVIRVELPAKVVGADDSTIVGELAPFEQTLSYGASKEITFTGTFKSDAEVETKVKTTLCPEIHEMELNPYRDNGVKGLRKFRQKLRPFIIQLVGTRHLASGGTSPYSTLLVCKTK